MTEEELKAIEDRANAATPGPWESVVMRDSRDDSWFRATVEGPEHFDLNGSDHGTICDTVSTVDNANFIADARSDIPKLVAEVKRLRDEVEHWRDKYMNPRADGL